MPRVAKALIYDPDGYALVLRRSGTHPHYAYEPDLPGGIIEQGESYASGLVREINEEAGISVDEAALTLARTNHGFDTRQLFEVHLPERPTVTISWEHDQFEWVAPDQLNAAMNSHDGFMRLAQNYLKQVHNGRKS